MVAVIGAGRPRGKEGATGFGMSHAHAKGYLATGHCRLVAVADRVEANARAFADEHGDALTHVFTEYRRMLREAKPDIVSICTWPDLHADMVVDAAEAGVRAIHCEKPMAPTWGDARRMAKAAKTAGAQLTFNHQRRFEAPYQTARRLVREGAIGDLVQVQLSCGDMFDWGTHWFDMLFFYVGEEAATWVIGQVDRSTTRSVFGVEMETQGVAYVGFASGVRGLMTTGDYLHDGPAREDGTQPRREALGAMQRLIGTEGVIEVGVRGTYNGKVRRLNGGVAGWQEVETAGAGHFEASIAAGIADLVACLQSGHEPELSVNKAIRCTELIFATYESSRRRARIDLPLDGVDGNPLHDMIAGH
jgi:predicted dehydrogenase